MIKIFFANGTKLIYKWISPFLDVMFYSTDESKTTWKTIEDQHSLKLPYSDIYPLHRRPFAGMCLYSVNNVLSVLKKKYTTFKCMDKGYDHLRERGGTSYTSECMETVPYYPVVSRRAQGSGILEVLTLNYTDLYSFYIPDTVSQKRLLNFNLF